MKNIFNNTYGLARTIIAIGNLATFALTDFNLYFLKDSFKSEPYGFLPNFFYLFGESGLLYSQIISCIILVWVISGYLPQISGILHAWLVFSFSTFSILIEGGDQISQIILILLIPVTLFDKRINHWFKEDYFKYSRPKFLSQFSYSCLVMIQIQMSVLYFFSFVEKFKVSEWSDGSAFYYWYNNHPFGANDLIKEFLNPFINYRIFFIFITWGVLALEIILFTAIFMSKRNKLKLFFIGFTFHLMIWLIHGLGSFYLAMSGGLILYLLPVEKSIDFRNIKKYFEIKSNLLKPILFKKKYVFFILLFNSCEKEENAKMNNSNEVLLDSTYVIAKDLYLWNDKITDQKTFNPLRFKTPAEILLEIRKFSPKNDQGESIDKWSFAVEKKSWDNLLNGNSEDFGCNFRFNEDNDLRIASVQINSSAGLNGLHRGLKVLSINDIDAVSSNINLLSLELETKSTLSINYKDDKTNVIKNTVIKKASYLFKPISSKIFTIDNNKLGYINLSSFISSVHNELPVILNQLKLNNVDNLIIDLRYNGGGLTSIMEEIANMLIPSNAVGKIMYTTRHNSNYSMFDSNTFFLESKQRLELKTIYFIVGHNTASSSEMLISAIKPYTSIFLIGQETQGKLVGMYTIPLRDYILAPISFKVFNANKESLEKSGFNPNYYSDDDVENDFDENEKCINAAIYHYKNNVFPISSKKQKNLVKVKNDLIFPNETLQYLIKEKLF